MLSDLATVKIGDAFTTVVGYGAMGIGGSFYGSAASDEGRFKLLDRLYELGERNLDTANIYGDSEELIGKWLKRSGNRADMFIATKFGIKHSGNTVSVCGEPQYMREEFEKSRTKLGVDVIDLYYLHRADPMIPIEVTVGAMAELVKEGKVKYLGLSECSPNTIRRAHKVHPIAAVQQEYSPFELSAEAPGGVLETCSELGIAVVSYSPTGRGLLTGRYKGPEDFEEGDVRRNIPKFSTENFPVILKLVSGLEKIGVAHNATAAQIAIAWLVAQGTIPIPGSKQIRYAEENLGSVRIKLEKEELNDIRKLVDEADKASVGERRPAAYMAQLLVETPAVATWSG